MEPFDPDTIIDIIEQRRVNLGIDLAAMDDAIQRPRGAWLATMKQLDRTDVGQKRLRVRTVQAAMKAVGLNLYVGRDNGQAGETRTDSTSQGD